MRRPTDELICEIGDQVEIAGSFTDLNGAAANPTRVFLTIADPDGGVRLLSFGVDADLSNPAVGTFRMEYVPVLAGRHYWRLWGEGLVNRAHVGTIVVLEDPTGRDVSGTVQAAVGAVAASAAGGVT
jgi:hypothetical protein